MQRTTLFPTAPQIGNTARIRNTLIVFTTQSITPGLFERSLEDGTFESPFRTRQEIVAHQTDTINNLPEADLPFYEQLMLFTFSMSHVDKEGMGAAPCNGFFFHNGKIIVVSIN